MTIANIINFVTSLLGSPASGETPGTGLIGWAGQFIDFVTDNPVILVFVITPLLFWGIGAIKRLIRL